MALGARLTAELTRMTLDLVEGRLGLPGLSQRLRSLADEVDALAGPQKALPGMSADVGKDGRMEQAVERVFQFWRTRAQKPKATKTPERERCIRARLTDGYSEEDLQKAILGGLSSEHYVDNDLTDIVNFLRNGTRVEQLREKVAQGTRVAPTNELDARISLLEEDQMVALREGKTDEANRIAEQLRGLLAERRRK